MSTCTTSTATSTTVAAIAAAAAASRMKPLFLLCLEGLVFAWLDDHVAVSVNDFDRRDADRFTGKEDLFDDLHLVHDTNHVDRLCGFVSGEHKFVALFLWRRKLCLSQLGGKLRQDECLSRGFEIGSGLDSKAPRRRQRGRRRRRGWRRGTRRRRMWRR